MKTCKECGTPLQVAEIDNSAKVLWLACPRYLAGDHQHTYFSEPLKQKWTVNLVDGQGQAVPGFERKLEGSRVDVAAAYLFWLEAAKGLDAVSEKNIHLEPIT